MSSLVTAVYNSDGTQIVDPNQVNAGIGALSANQASSLKSVLGTKTLGRPTRLYLGDSLTYYNVLLGLGVTAYAGSTFSNFNWAAMWGEWTTPSGQGSLSYDATTRTLRWAPAGFNYGNAVAANVSGMLYVPGPSAGQGLWVMFYGADLAASGYTSGVALITIDADGNQQWESPGNSGGGFGFWAQAYNKLSHKLAPFPDSLPSGMDGYYGMGGATAKTLLSCSPQFNQIAADSTVLIIGSNDDFTTTASTLLYLANAQQIINFRLATAGTRYVVWSSIFPRNTDTPTIKKNKAYANDAMMAWALTKNNQVHVLDLSTRVQDPANSGNWLTGMSADNIHPGAGGGQVLGKAIAEFDSSQALQFPYLGTVGDIYDATFNPGGNILNSVAANSGQMVGVGGTITGPCVTVAAWSARAFILGEPCITASGNLYICVSAGTAAVSPIHIFGIALDGTLQWKFIASGAVTGLATGWTLSRTVGTNIIGAACKVARTDGIPGEWQAVIVYGNAGTQEAVRLNSAASATGFTVGQEYNLRQEIVQVASSQLNAIGTQIAINGTSGSKQASAGICGGLSSAYSMSDASSDPLAIQVYETPAKWLTVAASSTLAVFSHLGLKNNGYAVVYFGRTKLRRVI